MILDNYSKKYIVGGIIIFVIIVLAVLLPILLRKDTKSVSKSENKNIETDELNEIPLIRDIILADIEDYDGYLFLPDTASYPQELLDTLISWPVSPEKKIPGRLYLYDSTRKNEKCKWVEHQSNHYCVVEN